FRVLRPGGVLVGSDSLPSDDLHHFHSGDTYNPIDPASLLGRLQTLGFDKITAVMDGIVEFVAPEPAGQGCDSGRGRRQAVADGRAGAEGRDHGPARIRSGRGAGAGPRPVTWAGTTSHTRGRMSWRAVLRDSGRLEAAWPPDLGEACDETWGPQPARGSAGG